MNFDVNEHGVVINPNEIELYENISIKTAKSKEGFWVYGVDIMLKNQGMGSPVIFTNCQKYKTENDAIKYAKKDLLKYLKRAGEEKIYNKIKSESEQLTLF